MNDLISVVIPCYNDGDFIKEAIESIINQTYKNTEILVVNDGSTDKNTLEVLKSLNYDNLKVYHKNNGHLSSARNYGFSHAKGEFVLTLDGDDKFHVDFIKEALPILKSDLSIAAVSSWAQHFGAKNNLKKVSGGKINDFLRYNQSTACALIRKKVWEENEGYDEKMKNGFEDWEFWINSTKKGYSIYIIPKPLFYYRIKKSSMITSTIKKRPEIYKYIIEKHKDVFDLFYPHIIFDLEKELFEQQEKFIRSTTYRLGYFLLFPFFTISKLFKDTH